MKQIFTNLHFREHPELLSREENEISSERFSFEVEGVLKLRCPELRIHTIGTIWEGRCRLLKVEEVWRYSNLFKRIIPFAKEEILEQTFYLIEYRVRVKQDEIRVDDKFLRIASPLFSFQEFPLIEIGPEPADPAKLVLPVRINLDLKRLNSFGTSYTMTDIQYKSGTFSFSEIHKCKIKKLKMLAEDELQRNLTQISREVSVEKDLQFPGEFETRSLER